MEFVAYSLKECGAEVIMTQSAAAARDNIIIGKPNVLVSDIGMPEEDGVSLIRSIRKLSKENGGDIPALALTAYASPEDRIKTLSAGFQMHLTKPIDPRELAVVIASLVGRS